MYVYLCIYVCIYVCMYIYTYLLCTQFSDGRFPNGKTLEPGQKKNRAPGRTPIARIRRAGIRPQFHQAADQGNLTPAIFGFLWCFLDSLVIFWWFFLVIFCGDCVKQILCSRGDWFVICEHFNGRFGDNSFVNLTVIVNYWWFDAITHKTYSNIGGAPTITIRTLVMNIRTTD